MNLLWGMDDVVVVELRSMMRVWKVVERVCGVELGFVWWELEQSRASLEVISSTGSWQKEKWARKSNSI